MEPRDPNYAERVRASFARQLVMGTIGARLSRVEPGAVDIAMPFRRDLGQQHGYLHAGIVSTVLDSACGYAAMSLNASGTAVLAVEFKVNFVAPAVGDDMVARGTVVKPGRTLTICRGEAFARSAGKETLVAVMQSTIMNVAGRDITD